MGATTPGGEKYLDKPSKGGRIFLDKPPRGGRNILDLVNFFNVPKTQFFHILWVFWALLFIFSQRGGAKNKIVCLNTRSFARDIRICGWCGPHLINNESSLIACCMCFILKFSV